MSTTQKTAAGGALTRGLVDDAAVFPPGNAPLPRAVEAHGAHRASWYAPAVGPLLVRLSDASALHGLLVDGSAVAVGLVCPADARAHEVRRALNTLQAGGRAVVTAIEQPLQETAALTAVATIARENGARMWAEVPPDCPLDDTLDRRLDDVTAAGASAKYRTGGVQPQAFPSEQQLARLLLACTGRGVSFKLTAGLHHAVRHTAPGAGSDGDDLEHHGLVNVMAAVAAAQTGASEGDLVLLLRERAAAQVVAHVAALDDESVRRLRQSFVSFGCCGVTDPLTDLVTLGLLERPAAKEAP